MPFRSLRAIRAESRPLSRHRTLRHRLPTAVTTRPIASIHGIADAIRTDDMHERELPQSQLSKRPDPSKSLCCTQCGGPLDAMAIKRFATRMDKVLCRDCAFDEMPCTD